MISLAERLNNELEEIKVIVDQTQKFIQRLSQEQDDIAKAALSSAIAFNLHSFYTGAERIFETIAKQVDQYQPSSANWHRQLLDQMLVELPDLRPPIISENTYLVLEELRRFRHVVRTIYAYQLEEERVLSLAEQALPIFPSLQEDIHRFLSQP